MQAFTTLTGVAAPLPLANVDTDKIIPARFLKTIKRTGLGQHLFDTLRFDASGAERPDFVLNQPAYRHSLRRKMARQAVEPMFRRPRKSFSTSDFQMRQGGFEVFHSSVGHLRVLKNKLTELLQLSQMLEPGIGDLRSAEQQKLEVFQASKLRESFVSHLRAVEIE